MLHCPPLSCKDTNKRAQNKIKIIFLCFFIFVHGFSKFAVLFSKFGILLSKFGILLSKFRFPTAGTYPRVPDACGAFVP